MADLKGKKFNIEIKPLSKFDKRENVANNQFYLRPDGRLFIVYDDEVNADGSYSLHDVTDQYEVKLTLA